MPQPQAEQNFTRRAEAAVRPSTANVEARTVEVVMSSETPYIRRLSSGQKYREILSHDPAHVRLERMKNGAPVLDNHNNYGSVSSQIGVVESVRLDTDTRQLIGTLRFSRKAKADEIFQDVVDGIVRNVSIGYTRYAYQDEEDADGNITRTLTDWMPYETSTVMVPADHTAQTRNTNPDNTIEIMPEANITPPADPATPPVDDVRAADTNPAPAAPVAPAVDVNEVRRLERERISAINDAVSMAGFDRSFADELIASGDSLAEATRKITAKWKAAGPATPDTNNRNSAVTADDTTRVFNDGMVEAILHRAGQTDGALSDSARRFAGMSFTRMAEEILLKRGENPRGMGEYDMVRRAFAPDRFTRAGYHSSTDFPLLLNTVINRTLVRELAYQTPTYAAWTTATTHTNFNRVEKVALSGLIGDLERVPEGGEYKAGTFSASKEGYAVLKYGKLLTYTWEMALADDIGFFSRVPSALVQANAQLRMDLVYAILTSNPNMGDGIPLFDTRHGNLSPGAALSEASVTAAITQFRYQTDANGKYLNLEPRFILVGPQNEFAARKLFASITPNTTDSVNVLTNALEVIVDPRIGNAWFLVADPRRVDTVERATLAGHPDLYTTTEETFNVDGTQMKARSVFGAKALDFRGLHMNPGA